MARIRTIKPEFFRDQKVLAVGYAARLLFQGLWTAADREGRLRDQPGQFKLDYFPTDRVNVEQLLSELLEQGMVRRYEVDGERFIVVVNFLRHQRPHPNEPQSILPVPPLTTENGEARDMTRVLVTSRDDSGGREGKGKEGDLGREGAKAPRPIPEDFVITPEMALKAKAGGCLDPTLSFKAFRLRYEGLRHDRHKGWAVNWPNKWEQWCLHHAQYGCPCQGKRTMQPIVAGGFNPASRAVPTAAKTRELIARIGKPMA